METNTPPWRSWNDHIEKQLSEQKAPEQCSTAFLKRREIALKEFGECQKKIKY
jgi:hypothetical protein